MVYGLILLLLSYCVVVSLFIWAWRDAVSKTKPPGTVPHPFISVVIAARNEARTLPGLLHDLAHQDYTEFEVVIVNDHSTDQTEAVVQAWEDQDTRFKLAANPFEGKKHALTAGIAAARGSVIVTTDADCRVGTHWLKAIGSIFAEARVQLAFGPVRMQQDNTFFARLQAHEFATLVGAAAATLRLGQAAMCNGANLAFRKEAFVAVGGYTGNLHIPSGDDEFLMRKITGHYPDSITFVNERSAIVTTQPQPSTTDFIYQRLRWAGKWRHNTSLRTQLLAVYILMVQLSLLALPVLISCGVAPPWALIVLLVRAVAEAWYIRSVARFLGVPFSLPVFLALQIIYPLYVVMTGVLSFFITARWKGRPTRSTSAPQR